MSRRRDIGGYVVELERSRKRLREYERILEKIIVVEFGMGSADIRERLTEYESLKIAKILFDGCGANTDLKRQELVMQILADRKRKATPPATAVPQRPTIAAEDSGSKSSDLRDLIPRKGA